MPEPIIGYTRRDAIAAVTNIDNAILQLEVFKEKAEVVIPIIDQIIYEIEDGGVGYGVRWRHNFWHDFRAHLVNDIIQK